MREGKFFEYENSNQLKCAQSIKENGENEIMNEI
jgi:hypothetical protein